MATASGARVQMAYVAESTHGTTPGSPSMKILRGISRNINLKKATLESQEVRGDRQVSAVRHGFNRVDGSLGFELALQAYDDMLTAALGGTFAVSTQVTPVSVTSLKFHRASGSFITDGYRIGDIIIVAGMSNSANNGQFRATVVTATDITVDATLINESAGAQTLDLVGKRCDVGSTLTTFTIERGFLDIAQYQVFKGCALNTMAISAKPEAIIQATLGFIGMSDSAMSGSSLDASPDAAATNSPMTSFEGSLYEGAVSLGLVTGLDFTLANGRALQSVIGSKFSPDVFEGRARVNGSLTVLFQDATLYNKFRAETQSSLWMRCDDPADTTKFLNFVFPNVKYVGGDIDPPPEGPIQITMPFLALYDAAAGTTMSIQRSNS